MIKILLIVLLAGASQNIYASCIYDADSGEWYTSTVWGVVVAGIFIWITFTYIVKDAPQWLMIIGFFFFIVLGGYLTGSGERCLSY